MIMHTDHREYRVLRPEDLPGVRALVDGRAIIDPERWADVPWRVLGIGDSNATRWREGKPSALTPPTD